MYLWVFSMCKCCRISFIALQELSALCTREYNLTTKFTSTFNSNEMWSRIKFGKDSQRLHFVGTQELNFVVVYKEMKWVQIEQNKKLDYMLFFSDKQAVWGSFSNYINLQFNQQLCPMYKHFELLWSYIMTIVLANNAWKLRFNND